MVHFPSVDSIAFRLGVNCSGCNEHENNARTCTWKKTVTRLIYTCSNHVVFFRGKQNHAAFILAEKYQAVCMYLFPPFHSRSASLEVGCYSAVPTGALILYISDCPYKDLHITGMGLSRLYIHIVLMQLMHRKYVILLSHLHKWKLHELQHLQTLLMLWIHLRRRVTTWKVFHNIFLCIVKQRIFERLMKRKKNWTLGQL